MEPHDFYTKTPPRRLFFLAAIPGAIGMLASSLYGLIDGVLVGRVLGETAFAALGLAFPFVIMNFSLADMIGVGSSVMIAIALGKKQEREANNIFTCALLLIVLTGTAVGALLYAAAPLLMTLMGAEGTLAELAVRFLQVNCLFSPVITTVFATDNYLRICGKIRTSMALNIFMSACIIVIEIFLLVTLKMGVEGAALATCIAMFMTALLSLAPFARKKLQLRFCRPVFSCALLAQIARCGAPVFVNNIAARAGAILFNAVLMRLGGQAAVAVYGILMYMSDLIQPLLYGVCDALQPAIGYNYGAGHSARIKTIVKYCFGASALISLAAMALMLCAPEAIIRLFLSLHDADSLRAAAHALQLFSLTYLTRWLSYAAQSTLTALAHPLQAAILSLCYAFVLPALLVVALWPLGLTGVWLNAALTSALLAVLSALFMVQASRKWYMK